MDSLTDLQNEKSKTLSSISLAASEGKTDLVLSESQKLEKIKLLINRHSQILLELEELRSSNSTSDSPPNSTQKEAQEKENILRSSRLASSRELGKKIRAKFLSKLEGEGIHLQVIRGKTIYLTRSGKKAGIAVATERQPNRWFLGLPAGGFDHAVLLCQRERGDLLEVPLPEKFFMKYGSSMSQSKGQVKFNIVQRGNKVLVQIPGTDGVIATSFSSDYSFLL